MKLTVHEFISLDGVMQGPGGSEEDTTGGFTLGGWVVKFADEDFGRIVSTWFAKTSAFLFGRTTYDMMSEFWQQVTDPQDPVAAALNGLPKYVVSTSLTNPQWNNSTVLTGDVIEDVRALKDSQPDGELQVHGSYRLARLLHDAGLVDEYRLVTFPVVLGQGKRLFEGGSAPSGFEQINAEVTSGGLIYQELRPIPLVITGEIAVEDGREVIR